MGGSIGYSGSKIQRSLRRLFIGKISHLISAWVGLGQVHRARWKGRGLYRVSSIYRGSEARESETFIVSVKEEGGKMSVEM